MKGLSPSLLEAMEVALQWGEGFLTNGPNEVDKVGWKDDRGTKNYKGERMFSLVSG